MHTSAQIQSVYQSKHIEIHFLASSQGKPNFLIFTKETDILFVKKGS